MGFMDKAKKLAEQAQEKLDEAQQNFNKGGSTPGQQAETRYDEHGRPVQDAPPAGTAPPPSADPAPPTPPTAPPAPEPAAAAPPPPAPDPEPAAAPPPPPAPDPAAADPAAASAATEPTAPEPPPPAPPAPSEGGSANATPDPFKPLQQ
jgi:hypothetical protein